MKNGPQALRRRWRSSAGCREPVTTYTDDDAALPASNVGSSCPPTPSKAAPGHNGFSRAHTPAVLADALDIMDRAAGSL